MSSPVPEPAPAPAPTPAPARPSFMKRALNGFVAAVTSPSAVAAEKSFAVFVAVRVLQSVGASAALVAVIVKLAGG